MKFGVNSKSFVTVSATILWSLATSLSAASDNDAHSASTTYEGKVLVEHADFIPVGTDGFTGYLTIWNGTNSEKVIRSVEIKPLGTAELARRVSSDVVRSKLDSSVVTVPPQSELHMDADTIFLLVNGQMPVESAEVIVRFDDGSQSSADSRFVIDETSLTDHHHPPKTTP